MSQLKDTIAIVGLSFATALAGCAAAQDADEAVDTEIAAVADQDSSAVAAEADESTGEANQAFIGWGAWGGRFFGWHRFGWARFGWGGFFPGFGWGGIGWGGLGWAGCGGFGWAGCGGLGWAGCGGFGLGCAGLGWGGFGGFGGCGCI